MLNTTDVSIIAQVSAKIAADLVAADKVDLDGFAETATTAFETVITLVGGEDLLEKVRNGEIEDKPARRSGGGRSGGSGRASRGNSDPGTLEINGGKHAGKTIQQAYDEDSEYVEWFAENGKNKFLAGKMSEFLDAQAA